ncbi:MAG: DUF3761 domain-containing protein [Gemmatimonadaceae bacterium]
MRLAFRFSVPFAIGLACLAAPLSAQKPAGATGVCKDGSFTTSATKVGACSGHGGVKEFYAAAGKKTADASKKSDAKKADAKKADAKKAEAKPAPAVAPAPVATKSAPATQTAPVAGAPAAATAQCNDGTFSESKHRSGACSSHKGVKQWLKTIPPA